MANARGKDMDTTSLSIEEAAKRGWIHRDYIAHVFRWQHVVKKMRGPKFKDMWLLDVGCGKEAPLPFTLYSNVLNHKGGKGGYLGLDYGRKIEPHHLLTNAVKNGTFNASFVERCDFTKGVPVVSQGIRDDPCPHEYDVVTCFEVVEHVEPFTAFQVLSQIAKALKSNGTAYISTPVFDPKVGAAANHVNEMSYTLMECMIAAAGMKHILVYGTFASQKDLKPVMTVEHRDLLSHLSQYHDPNVLANFFAPLYPQQSRNCLWVCVADPSADRKHVIRFMKNIPSIKSSSTSLADDIKKIAKAIK